VKVIGRADTDIMHLLVLVASAQFFYVTVKTLKFGEKHDILKISVQHTGGIMRVNCGDQPITGLPDGFKVTGSDIPGNPGYSEILRHYYLDSSILFRLQT
jgi:hypothetical protein